MLTALRQAHDVSAVGGKASNLARLIDLGLPVPDGFVVPNAALQSFLADGGLTSRIESATAGLDPRRPAGLHVAAEAIRAAIRSVPLPASLISEIGRAYAELGSDVVIVRSSAVGEDSAGASFAGQLDSIADVTDAALLGDALRDVWASRWSSRVLSYQVARNVSLEGMGAIVQRQARSAISGVLFTRAPGRDAEMLLEYCEGMGEALVSGRETPGRVSISRRDGRWTTDATPSQDRSAPDLLLDDRQVSTLARTGLVIERAFGGAQDIEWTIDADGRLWILQARPITVHRPFVTQVRSAPPDPDDVADRAVVHWSNANVNENFPEPISPLLYSIARLGYYHYFRGLGRAFGISRRRLAAMEQPLRTIVGVHSARLYYNLTSIHGVLRSAPFGECLTSSFNLFVGAEATTAPPALTRRRRMLEALEVARIAFQTAWQYAFLTRRVERFERRVSAFAERTHPDRLAAKSLDDLLDDLRGFLDIRCHKWTDAGLADAASMVCYAVLQRLLVRAYPAADQAALHNTLLKALPGLVSSIPAQRLWDLSRHVRSNDSLRHLFATSPVTDVIEAIRRDPQFENVRLELDRFLEEWGFRCSGELMLTTASFQEEPEKLVDLLRAYVANNGDSPADALRRQELERLAETSRVRGELESRRLHPWLPFVNEWLIVSLALRWTQKAILLRERARLKQALLYSRLRRIALAIGRRLEDSQRLERDHDVFYLSSDEIDALLSGSAMFPHHLKPLVDLRRAAHGQLSALQPPDAFTLRANEYLPANMTLGPQTPPPDDGEGDVSAAPLPGTGACGGEAIGRAAVLTDLSQADRLLAGDVLITKQTDPGWGPVFPLIAGLVMERGGMLSHGAIIAREFGIPSVVGVRDATRRISHGSRVRVDGDRGSVQLLLGKV